MSVKKENTSNRKKGHLDICLNKDVSFNSKTNGLDKYEFEHNALTEVDIDKIDFTKEFFGKKISYPFLISCMTGGTYDAMDINAQLALAARELNIPIGVGSQRQVMESREHINSYDIIRKNAGSVPVLGNIGAAQIAASKEPVKLIEDLGAILQADIMVIHLNPLQELFQNSNETNFSGLIRNIKEICSEVRMPVIVKEVGAGISGQTAKKLLKAGVNGIDVAGAGGTSWAAVEMMRNNNYDEYFREWGLPTSFCIKQVKKLKEKYDFTLIASGGINSGVDVAKILALGADMGASAMAVLKEVAENKAEGVVNLINNWFITVKKVMYLTGAGNLDEFSNVALIKKEDLY